jgi:hypothetical protein
MSTRCFLLRLTSFFIGPALLSSCASASVSLTPAQLQRVGLRIWQNECAGSVAGLTSWNAGEDFASLGIGHFIWYPAGRRGPQELRKVLSKTVSLQTEFILARLQRALPQMKAASRNPALVEARFQALSATPEGAFCLIDYVNFKGEGTAATERYQGQGWGLLQVLEGMSSGTPPAFAASAKAVLSRRVQNAPAERKELTSWPRCPAMCRRCVR